MDNPQESFSRGKIRFKQKKSSMLVKLMLTLAIFLIVDFECEVLIQIARNFQNEMKAHLDDSINENDYDVHHDCKNQINNQSSMKIFQNDRIVDYQILPNCCRHGNAWANEKFERDQRLLNILINKVETNKIQKLKSFSIFAHAQQNLNFDENKSLTDQESYDLLNSVEQARQIEILIPNWEQEDIDSLNRVRILAPKAPTPELGTNLDIQYTRSSDCLTVYLYWSYTFSIGSGNKVDCDILDNYDSTNWNVLVKDGTNKLSYNQPILVSLLRNTNNNYYFGQPVNYRLRFESSQYDNSQYYFGTSPSDWLKSKPTAFTVAPSVVQEILTLTFSWTLLASTWSSTSSPVGTGNDPVYYKLERFVSGTTWAEITTPGTYGQSSIIITMPNTDYPYNTAMRFRLTPSNICGTATESPELAYTIKSSVPVALSAPTLVSAFDQNIQVQWTAPTTAANKGYHEILTYELSYAQNIATPSYKILTDTLVTSWTQTSQSDINSGWIWGASYLYRVRASNTRGYSSYSSTLTVAMPSIPTTAPTLTLVSKSMSGISFSWVALTTTEAGKCTITHYWVRWRLSSISVVDDNTWTSITGSSGYTSLTATQTSGIVGATSYNYQIRAHNQAGIGPWSSSLLVSMPTVPVKMASPTWAATPTTITISWTRLTSATDTGNDPISSYVIQWCLVSSCSWSTAATALPSASSNVQTISSMPRGVQYYYRIYATNGVGSSTVSDLITVTTDNIPQSMTAVSCTNVEPQTMTLTWTALATAQDGGDAISFYGVEIYSGSTWTQVNSDYSNLYVTYTYNHGANFAANTVYNFRVRAKNGVDYGTVYQSTSCTSDGPPTAMGALTQGTVNPKDIFISWSELTDTILNGRDLPIYYEVEWENKEVIPTRWDVMTTSAIGLKTSYTYTRSTIFPSGSIQRFRVLPYNNIGPGTAYSPVIEITADSVPITCNNPSVTDADIFPGKITLTWSQITTAQNGGDPVVFYLLEWDQGIGSWTSLNTYTVGMAIPTSYEHIPAANFPSGQSNKYRLSALNGVGYSVVSSASEVTIVCDSVPTQMAAPTNISVAYNAIALSWTALTTTSEIGRDPITYYRLDFFNRKCYDDTALTCTTTFVEPDDGSWVELTSSSTSPLATTKTHTTTSKFTENKLYNYRVSASNGVGMGTYSSIISVQTPYKPTFMNSPSVDSIDAKQIVISWVALDPATEQTSIGLESITFYQLECDPATGTFAQINPNGALVTTYTQTSTTAFTPNSVFKYRVSAYNALGMGVYSSLLSITTDDYPVQTTGLAVETVSPFSISISWTALTTQTEIGRDYLTYYQVEYHDNKATTTVWTTLTTSTVGVVTTNVHDITSTKFAFPANIDQTPYFVKYKVTASNNVGLGPESAELLVQTKSYPKKMGQLTISDPTPDEITITWTLLSDSEADTGGDPIFHYMLVWVRTTSPVTTTWTNLTTSPFTSNTVTLSDSEFNDDSEYTVKIAAVNKVGIGYYSDDQTLFTDAKPRRMNTPTENSDTNATYIKIDWEGITSSYDTGGDPINRYRVYWKGTGSWNEATDNNSPLVYSWEFKSGIIAGNTYQFKIRPKNDVGSADIYSDILSVIPSSPPDRMSRPVVSLANVDTSIKITWTNPASNGAEITEYLIKIKGSDGEFYTSLDTCDGSLATIVSNMYCYVPMATLKAAPFSLAKGDAICVSANARNLKGFNNSDSDTITTTSFTVVVETEPNAPAIPVKGANTHYNILHSTWSAITSYTVPSGGVTAAILSYEFARNTGNSSNTNADDDTWVSLTGFSPSQTNTYFQTSTDIVGGTTYKVRVRALNKHGWGPWGPYLDIICARAPNAVTWITTTNSTTNFLIRWEEPFNNGLQIERYHIRVQKKGTANQPSNFFETDDCLGNDETINETETCMIKMTTLRSSTYLYTLNSKIVLRIWAENLMGAGTATVFQTTASGNNAMIQTQPSAPTTPITNTLAVTSDLQIKISWQVLPTHSWGGIKIDQYDIFWFDPNAFSDWEYFYQDVPTFKLTYTHVKTSADDTSVATREIIPGTLYKFKYRGVNIHGEGANSTEVSIYASTVPDKVARPVTSLSNTTVTIEWSATPNDHAQAITKYAIRFKASNGTYLEDSGCAGTSATIISAMKCTMAMSKFIASPFNLQIDTLIEVTVDVSNVMGWSGQSLPNTVGVTVKRNPQAAPTGPARGINTGKNTIHLTWVGLISSAQTGGQDVDYRIYYDKALSQANWFVLVTSTANATSYQELNSVIFKTGNLYNFKIQAWNDFGLGSANSTVFGIWTAISPSGLAAPTTSFSYNAYSEEDDYVLIDWEAPTDNGGLSVSYSIEIMAKSGSWTSVNTANECYENNAAITDYKMPKVAAAELGTRCIVMVSNLKTKYLLTVGDTVQARITATHVVGSVTSDPGGAAVLPIVPCFRTTFPRVFGGSNSNSFITVMDVDDNGHIVVGGYTQDSNLLEGKVLTQTQPIAAYIAKGNYYAWAKYFQTTDTINTQQFQFVSDITFRWDGEKAAIALDKSSYDISYMIVVLNKDGTLYGAYREGASNAKGKISPNGMIFDSANMITIGVDMSADGTTTKRQAILNRFSVSQATGGNFNTQFYLIGGSSTTGSISQVLALQRIRGDTTQFYLSALITDASGNRRSILGKSQFTNGALQKYFVYVAGAEYNSDTKVGVVKRMNLEENDILNQHIISACIMSQDNYRIHFGEFIFLGTTQTQTVLTPNQLSTYNTYNCLGTFSRSQGTAYFLYNYRKDANSANHKLILGRVSVTTKKLNELEILSHVGVNQYGGAKFIHMSRFYYFGTTNKIHKGNTLTSLPQFQGWINIFDPLEWSYSCNPTTQSFSIPTGSSINLDQVLVVQMDWKTSGLTSSTGFANTVVKQMKSLGSLTGLNNLNLQEPNMNNTWCPIVTTGGGAPTLIAPTIPFQMFNYNPDITGSQTQSFQFDPITISRYCPDTVIYNLTYLSSTNQALPSFVSLKGENNSYVFDVSLTSHVGTYPMMLMVTLGNNKSSSVMFTSQVASPCLNNPVSIPDTPTPIYDLSEWSPKFIDLNWDVTYLTPSCASVYQIFQLVNASTGGPIDPNIYSIVNQSSGIQRIKIWTQFIPYAKIWTDLLVSSFLQGDFVASKVFTITITNDCGETLITPQVMPNWIYYTGRDSIDLTFVWSETVGKCGPISYAIQEYLISNTASNNSLDSSIFAYPSVAGTNNTMKIFTADESKVGIYRIRVYASLGVGGYKQSETIFTTQIIRDPCAFFTFTVPFIDDITLWINQTDQTQYIPFFQMSDPIWICNFTYVITNGNNGALDSVFVKNEVVPQATNPSITLMTTDKSKVDLSPYTIKVKGWPTRQASSVAMSLSFRVFIAYLDKADCSSGKFYNSVTETCDPCQTPCSTCIGAADKCTWCQDDFLVVDDGVSFQCIPRGTSCPFGTVKDPYLAICRKCSEFCKVCTDIQTCTTCITGYTLANKYCYPPRSCPEGFSYNGNGCTECSTGCASCVSNSKCNYCIAGMYLNTLTNACVANCPAGYYNDVKSRVCMICSPACGTCVNNNFTCTSCRDVTVSGVTTYKYLFINTCVDRCPYLQYFQNFANRSCDPCNTACKICVGAINDCIVCNDKSVISGRSCLNSCPEKSYITDIGTCFPCDPACQICTGPMNSMCSQCVTGQYLTQTTCEPKCNPPLFPDDTTKSCKECPYYCNSCTMATDCQKCKTGYKQIPNNCEGEQFVKVSPNSVLFSVPMADSLSTFNPRELTSEIWFKADNVMSSFTEIILGTSPYKLRKKSNLAQIQLNFDKYNYCDSSNLKSDQWYHFAYSLGEDPSQLNCYLNGEKISTGLTSVGLITADILKFKEITFGNSIEIKTSESKFTGYIKEFRWWNVIRSSFLVINFKDISFTTAPSGLISYWRLDEDRNTATFFKDSAAPAASPLIFTPVAPFTLKQIVEMREIYLKICPEGTFGQFNETSNMQECIQCSSECKNCNGITNTSCTECNPPYKLIEAEQKCVVVEGCPQGYYEDKNMECQPCHEYCVTCVNTPFQCPKCKNKYFKQYKGLGCTDSCPRGLYGNYLTQSCAANPIVTSLYPEDGLIFSYGTFIDLQSTFEVLNSELRSTYSYGWIISKLNTNVNLAGDAAKPYFGTDVTRVHLDNNIIEPNNYYNITFYVKGNDQFYNGMIGSMFNVIYIGIPPKNGKCFIAPQQGIAGVTTFKITTSGWIDVDGIAEYAYLYSYDHGQTFIPIPTPNSRLPSVTFIFDPVFSSKAATIQCKARSIKGFTADALTSFVLIKRSSANAKIELQKINLAAVTDEKQALLVQSQIELIAKELGKLEEVNEQAFDYKINADQCTNQICSYNGQCMFDSFSKKYYCQCDPGKAGVNCTFKNETELFKIRNLTLELAKIYNPLSLSGWRAFDFDFLRLVTKNQDIMTEDIQNSVIDILSYQISHLKTEGFNVGDNSDIQMSCSILSNLLEYQKNEIQRLNQTSGWKNLTNSTEKKLKIMENMNKSNELINQIRNCSLRRLSFLQTEINVQTRMIAFRQVLTTQDKILTMPATSRIKKQKQTYVKISPTNFIGSNVYLSKEYIAETIEYAFNPFQINNTNNVASNVFEVNLYNYNKSLTGLDIKKAEVKNLTIPFEFAFPVSDNQNLSDFLATYNLLSNFKYSEVIKKETMIKKSNLSCVYWDQSISVWSKEGCQLQGLDNDHVKCNCSHLSAFTILFTTPKLTIDAPLLENTTQSAQEETRRNITLKDIVKWPLDAYFSNMYKLWQHNRPTFISFIVKPGFAVLILFWAMYLSSLIYYSGRDDMKRFKMTKQQNRDDLAELNDDNVQNVQTVIKDLIVKDFINENGKFIQKESRRKNAPQEGRKAKMPPKIKIYEQLSKEEQKKFKKRARRKVFGIPAGLCARAQRVYDITMKHNTKNPNAKMSFFNEELKNNLWIGLIAKTSKIAPRHVRLLLMYFYSSLYITLLTIIFAFQIQDYISDQALFQVATLAVALIVIVWIITIPVALIFRMPLRLRMMVAGVRTKKLNKAFKMVDQYMGWRYAIGYFICLSMFFIMTVLVLILNIFYPHDYVMGWFFNIILIYIFDLIVFTFLLAAIQMVLVILSAKAKCFYHVWKAIEVFRYVKNLRG